MITLAEKAKAVNMLKLNIPLEDVSKETGFSTPLLKEWLAAFDERDTLILEANVTAAERVIIGEVLDPDKVDILKDKLIDAAHSLTEDMVLAQGDPLYAKSLQLIGQTIATLWSTICQPAGSAATSSSNDSMFAQLMKD